MNTADDSEWLGGAKPGTPAVDAPMLRDGAPDWLLRHTHTGFTSLVFGPVTPDLPGVATVRIAPDALHDVRGLAAQRYGAEPGTCILLRPDQHVAARFRSFDAAWIAAALQHIQGSMPARLEPVA